VNWIEAAGWGCAGGAAAALTPILASGMEPGYKPGDPVGGLPYRVDWPTVRPIPSAALEAIARQI